MSWERAYEIENEFQRKVAVPRWQIDAPPRDLQDSEGVAAENRFSSKGAARPIGRFNSGQRRKIDVLYAYVATYAAFVKFHRLEPTLTHFEPFAQHTQSHRILKRLYAPTKKSLHDGVIYRLLSRDDVKETDSDFLPFLSELYAKSAVGDTDGALDMIFDKIDDLLEDRSLEKVNSLLASVDVARLDVTTALGFLSTTYIEKEHLRDRNQYSDRLQAHLLKTMSKAEVAELVGRLA